jgi:hypothetical protein
LFEFLRKSAESYLCDRADAVFELVLKKVVESRRSYYRVPETNNLSKLKTSSVYSIPPHDAGSVITHSSIDDDRLLSFLQTEFRGEFLDVLKVLFSSVMLVFLESTLEEWSDRVVLSPHIVESTLGTVRTDLKIEEFEEFRRVNFSEFFRSNEGVE